MKPEKLSIPDKWIAGYLLGHPGATVADAVACWQEQERLERLHRALCSGPRPETLPTWRQP